jgi:hypothetical protein
MTTLNALADSLCIGWAFCEQDYEFVRFITFLAYDKIKLLPVRGLAKLVLTTMILSSVRRPALQRATIPYIFDKIIFPHVSVHVIDLVAPACTQHYGCETETTLCPTVSHVPKLQYLAHHTPCTVQDEVLRN